MQRNTQMQQMDYQQGPQQQQMNPFQRQPINSEQEQQQRYGRVAKAVSDMMMSQGLNKQEIISILKGMHEDQQDLDYDYICCVLFPETHPAVRVPSTFSVPSSIFSHKATIYVKTGTLGTGFISVLPLDTSYTCAYGNNPTSDYVGSGVISTNPIDSAFFDTTCSSYNEADCTYIPQNFAQVRLIACSARLQYIGQAQLESGFLSASHVYESEIGKIDDDIIENGFFNVRGRPSEGARLVWIPKDTADQEFFDTNVTLTTSYTTTNFNPLIDVVKSNGALTVNNLVTGQILDGGLAATGVRVASPSTVWGIGAKKYQASAPTQLVFGWKGMPQGQTWLRLDIERHFEGIPRTQIRQIVATARPTSNQKSMDIVQDLQKVPELFGSKMTEAPHVKKNFVSKFMFNDLGKTLDMVGKGFGGGMMNLLPIAGEVVGSLPFGDTIKQGLDVANGITGMASSLLPMASSLLPLASSLLPMASSLGSMGGLSSALGPLSMLF